MHTYLDMLVPFADKDMKGYGTPFGTFDNLRRKNINKRNTPPNLNVEDETPPSNRAQHVNYAFDEFSEKEIDRYYYLFYHVFL